jgi:hypothetical protein
MLPPEETWILNSIVDRRQMDCLHRAGKEQRAKPVQFFCKLTYHVEEQVVGVILPEKVAHPLSLLVPIASLIGRKS